MRSTPILKAGLILAVLFFSCQAEAMSVLPVSLQQMTRESGVIVHGTVIDVRTLRHESLGISVTEITVQSEELIKGDQTSQVRFRQVNGLGLPEYAVGQEIVVFLYPNSRANVTSPVGGPQGLFKVIQTSEGKAVRNPFLHVFTQAEGMASSDSRRENSFRLDVLKGQIRQNLRMPDKGVK